MDRASELSDAPTEGAAEVGDSTRAEEKDDDCQNDDQLHGTDCKGHCAGLSFLRPPGFKDLCG